MITILICAVIAWFMIPNRYYFDEAFETIGIICLGILIGVGLAYALPTNSKIKTYNYNLELWDDSSYVYVSKSPTEPTQIKFNVFENGVTYTQSYHLENVTFVLNDSSVGRVIITRSIDTDSWINWFALDISINKCVIYVSKDKIRQENQIF